MDIPTKEEVEAKLGAALVEFVQCRMTPALYQEMKARIVAVLMKITETYPMPIPDEMKLPCARCSRPIEAGDLELCTDPIQTDVVMVVCGRCKRMDEAMKNWLEQPGGDNGVKMKQVWFHGKLVWISEEDWIKRERGEG